MSTSIKEKLLSVQERFLNRLMALSAVLLVVAVAGFVIYYNLDRQSGESPVTLADDIVRIEEEVRADPENLAARLALAGLYYADGRYVESTEQYEAALTIDDESLMAMVGLGRSLLEVGDQARAIESFQRVVDAAAEADIPGDLVETAHYYMGSVYLDQGQLDDAIVQLENAVAIDRADADGWYLLGVAYLESGNLEGAIMALTRAAEFVPSFAEAYESLVVAYERKGLEGEASYARGMLAFSLGRFSEAERELAAAHDASPESVDVFVGLGLVRESQGDHESAAAYYHQALALEPDNFNATAGLARLDVPAPEGVIGEAVAQ
jgi:tetratricopeptide (TPR) repeat protein